MENCKYCSSLMIGETETKRDKTNDFFIHVQIVKAFMKTVKTEAIL